MNIIFRFIMEFIIETVRGLLYIPTAFLLFYNLPVGFIYFIVQGIGVQFDMKRVNKSGTIILIIISTIVSTLIYLSFIQIQMFIERMP